MEYVPTSFSASPQARTSDKEPEHWSLEMEASRRSRPATPRKETAPPEYPDPDATPRASLKDQKRRLSRSQARLSLKELDGNFAAGVPFQRPTYTLPRSLSASGLSDSAVGDHFTGGILEQAWLAKIQADNRRRAHWEKAMRATSGLWERLDAEAERSPPPAYAA